MKKSIAVIISILLLAALFSLAGCSKNKTSESASSSQPKVSDKTTNSDAAELQKLFKTVSGVKGFSYEMVSTLKGPQGTMATQSKCFMTEKKVRIEMDTQGMKSVIIYNGSGDAYMYTPSTNTAIKSPMPKEKPANQWAKSSEDLANFTIVGHEKMGGYDCVVVTSTTPEGSVKMWLREDIGLPVRIESGDNANSTVIEYKNIQVGPQPDSLFELPAGAKVIDMSNIQKGQIPGMPAGQNMPKIPPMPQGAQ